MTARHRPGLTAEFAELYKPKILTTLAEGYSAHQFRADLLAALTVAIVALPLSMAIAIASGATPAQGLYTAIVGGFLVSALGGSRFQIGGPAGAFIVLVATTLQLHGMDGLILAVMLSGVLLIIAGLVRLGAYVKFIPYPVTVGFTAGIAVVILLSQVKDLLGLNLSVAEPLEVIPKLAFIWRHLHSINMSAVVLSVATIGLIAILRRIRPGWPGMLIAVALTSALAAILDFPVETIGTRFGGIPNHLPSPVWPAFELGKVLEVFPSAVAFALLGSIESLLSAVVADGMTGRRHRSNCELVAQGVANIASGLFGGICVTGTIARTATNVRAGAYSPVSGMLHALLLLVFVLVAAPLASKIPLATLAGILVVVAWNMVEKQAFASLFRASLADTVVLMATFLLTVFRDLTEAIIVGVALGSILFIQRMAAATKIESDAPLFLDDKPDTVDPVGESYDGSTASDPTVIVYRISGAFFFGAAASVGSVLGRISDRYETLIIDFSAVPFLDSTAANLIEGLARRARKTGVSVLLSGASGELQRTLDAHGVRPPLVEVYGTIEEAVTAVRGRSRTAGESAAT